MSRRFACAFCVILFASICHAAEPTTRPILQFDPGVKSVTVRGVPSDGLITVPARVNGQDAGWMLIDTGTTGILIDTKLAEKLKLKRLSAGTYQGIGGELPVTLVPVDEIALGTGEGATMRLKPVIATTANLALSITTDSKKIVGVIGAEVLTEVPTSFDFRDCSVTFHHPSHFVPPAGPSTELKILAGLPAVRVMVCGQFPGWFAIDTGMNNRAHVGGALYTAMKPHVKPKWAITTQAEGAVGKRDGWHGEFPTFEYFGEKLTDVGLSFDNQPPPANDAIGRLPGLIGMGLLEEHVLTFDLPHGRAWCTPMEKEPAPAMAERLRRGPADRGGQTPLMRAARAGRTDVLKLLLEQGEDPAVASALDETAIFLAASRGDEAMVRALLAKKVNPNVPYAIFGSFALEHAVRPGNAAVVQALIEGGAKVDQTDLLGKTALYVAAEMGATDCAHVLIAANASVEKAAKSEFTPLLLAAERGYTDIVLALLDAGAIADKPAPLIIFASRSKSPGLIAALLDRGMDVNARTVRNETPLMNAAASGDTAVVRLLLERGADPTLKNKDGKTALDMASQYAGLASECVRVLGAATLAATTRPAKE